MDAIKQMAVLLQWRMSRIKYATLHNEDNNVYGCNYKCRKNKEVTMNERRRIEQKEDYYIERNTN